MHKIIIVGCSGSVGKQSLEVVDHSNGEIEIVGIAAYGSDIDNLLTIINKYKPKQVAIFNDRAAQELSGRCFGVEILSGDNGLCELVLNSEAQTVIFASSGLGSIKAIFAAAKAGKRLCIANKEVVVSGGELLMQIAKDNKATIIPVDSEHSAIFQCLGDNKNASDIHKIVLTASGGPFLHRPIDSMQNVSIEEVLNHPKWTMGKKITVDCSNMVNKGLEIIEAKWLFDLPIDKIEAIVHPQSIIHGMVEFMDGSIIAQLGATNMICPIQYAITWPNRASSCVPFLDLLKHNILEFLPVDNKKFRGIELAKWAMIHGKSYTCCFNAANDVLVHRFLNKEISWIDIVNKLEIALENHRPININSIDDVLYIDREERTLAASY